MDAQDAWERLARLVRDRREREGWTQLDVVTRGGPSLDRLQAIEASRTTRYSGRTLAKLERGLGWEAGSVRAILDGGEPTDAESAAKSRRESADEVSGRREPLTDEELRASGLAPETVEAIIAMRRRIERAAEHGDETLIRRMNRVTEALDEERDAG